MTLDSYLPVIILKPNLTFECYSSQLPQYDLVLESYCRLKFCEEENYEDCQEIPVMRFYSFPKPTVNCTFQGKSTF